VSIAAATDHPLVEPAESPLTPESWGKLGMWTFLAADAMTFGALLAGYGALRYGDPSWPRPSTILGIPLTALMTFLLICSSVTMVEGLAGIRQGNKAKFGATFFILTGFHGMHVFSGVVYLTIILLVGMAGRFTAERSSPVEIAGLYWHFVDLIWILVFTFVYLI